jgi:hypothetical protein
MSTFARFSIILALTLAGTAPVQATLIINEFLADPASGLEGDANGDGIRHAGDDEFVELVNASGAPLDIGGWTVSDAGAERHEFVPGTTVAADAAILVFGGGRPTGLFGGTRVVTASSDGLGLNNGGDIISLRDAASNLIDSLIYGVEAGDDQSLTLAPDLAGTFVKHATAPGSNGTRFSPGTRIDGTPFGPSGVPAPTPLLLIALGGGCLTIGKRLQAGR